MIARILEQTIQEKLGQGKAIIIMGPRQVGKTTLLKQMFTDSNDIWTCPFWSALARQGGAWHHGYSSE